MSDYKMTTEQKAYLNSLICQRISDDEANKDTIKKFSNPLSSPGITGALKNGWNADKKDRLAYYIIKDPADNEPLLFFSLKCGEIHLPLDPAKLDNSVKQSLILLQAAASRAKRILLPLGGIREYYIAMDALSIAKQFEVEDWAKEVIEKQLVDDDLPEKAWLGVWKRVFRSRSKLELYKAELEEEKDNIIRTKKTFPAVELVHFCAHAPAQEKWKSLNMGRSLGRTMFWHFIEPKIRDIRKLVGCEYLYLFAADDDRNGSLCTLYKEMGFDFRDDLYLTKPSYDFCCYFMCQNVSGLRTRKNEFVRNFNEPKEAKTPATV